MSSNTPHRSNVFELSLTEIAFILIFILLLLLGGLYFYQYRESRRLAQEVEMYRDSVGSVLYLDSIRTELQQQLINSSGLTEREGQQLINKVLDHRIDENKYAALDELLTKIEQSDGTLDSEKLLLLIKEKRNLNDLKLLNQLIEQNLSHCKNPEEFISHLMLKDECTKQKFALNSKILALQEELSKVNRQLIELNAVQEYLDQEHITADEFLRINELNDLNHFLVAHKIAIDDLQSDIEALQKSKKENEALRDHLQSLQSKINNYELELQAQIEALQESEKENEALRDHFQSLQSKINNYELELQAQIEALQEREKENVDLKGQIQYIQSKINKNGLDHPPCWANEAGKIEYLFTLNLYPDYLEISPAWPESRQEEAMNMPNVANLANQKMNYNQFISLSRAIFDSSRNKNPECRYFVKLKNHIPMAKESDSVRRRIEAFFYKLEL